MSPTVPIALFGILPVGLAFCGALSARAGILATLLAGWLFLPVARVSVVGIPDYDKLVATNLAILLGCLVFHGKQLFSFRFSWIDLPMVLWCFAPSFSSLTNDLGAYDAVSVGMRQFLVWAIPYGIGRTFFNTPAALRDVATALVVGGLIYLPLCLAEVRLSPQLNNWVYGFHQNQFWRNIRFGGFRPVVFMQSGLMVGTWMATATLVAFWSWVTGSKRLMGIPWPAVVVALLTVTFLCKALYAILLLIAAIGLLTILRFGRTKLPLVALLCCAPAYMALRSTELVPAESVAEPAAPLFGADRAQSLEARLLQEDALLEHVSTRPTFGWGGWRRSWPIDPETGEYELRGLDGMWTIIMGENGMYGLFTVFAMLLAPVALVLYRFDVTQLNENKYGATAALSVSLLLFSCDCLLNGMLNPFYLVLAGALTSLPAPSTAMVTDRATADPALAFEPIAAQRSLQWRRPQLRDITTEGQGHA